MYKALSIIALVALLGGCASSTPTAASSKSAPTTTTKVTMTDEELRKQEILCTRETKTGSHRKTRVCRTLEQRKREREAAAEILNNTQTGGTKAIN